MLEHSQMVSGMSFLENFIVDTTFPVVPGNTVLPTASERTLIYFIFWSWLFKDQGKANKKHPKFQELLKP